MRMVPATLGIATIPLAYLTLRALDCKASTALLASLFLTFENGLVTQSRHILLDSPLVFFTALTIFLFVGFSNEDRHQPFSESWWAWLVLTGLSLGAVVSCKWVGLFTIATVGVCTILRLWLLLGDTRVSLRTWSRHFFARALCLIAIPILFYMTMFEIHFLILGSSGDGDACVVTTLIVEALTDDHLDVAIGSQVTIRHVNTQGGYLHSHLHNYPGGSGQQQITLYPHRDENNLWLYDFEHQPIEYIKHGSRIKLRHIVTDKALHSHDVRPPVSDVDFQNEVSGYGLTGYTGDLNDDWVVEIYKGDRNDKESSKRLKTLRTHFKLRHLMTGCYLFSHTVKLPEWAFDQQEVTCNKQAVKANSLWYIETASKHPQRELCYPLISPECREVNYKIPGFLSKFWELQKVMWTTNSKLTDRHVYDSRPWSWPFLSNFWVKDHKQIYLIGNPFVWWSSTVSVITYMLIRGLLILRAKRGYRDFENTKLVKYDMLCGFLFTGYALHYLPFFLMSRQLFLHHYFPALYFAILLSSVALTLQHRVASSHKASSRLRIDYSSGVDVRQVFPTRVWESLDKEQVQQRNLGQNLGLRLVTSIQAATSNKSILGATIGGEPGGRAAVIVDDVVDVAHAAKGETSTMIPLGGAEPGRDVFAQRESKEVKSSQSRPEVVSPEEKERVVSVVGGTTEGISEVSNKGYTPNPPQQGGSTSEQATLQGGHHKTEGPLDQAEALANEVAHELYPEDNR
ncbi:glycosyltransferase family 39 protein [Pisolithus sp. B1]|nr:glycosyltransferase family 39 protein [Pisolithus sp. B1]